MKTILIVSIIMAVAEIILNIMSVWKYLPDREAKDDYLKTIVLMIAAILLVIYSLGKI